MIETTSCDNIPNLDPFYEPKSSNKCRSRIPRRYLIAFLGFFGFLHVYLLRVNMSFAIVAMTSNNSRIDSNGTTYYVLHFFYINFLNLNKVVNNCISTAPGF